MVWPSFVNAPGRPGGEGQGPEQRADLTPWPDVLPRERMALTFKGWPCRLGAGVVPCANTFVREATAPDGDHRHSYLHWLWRMSGDTDESIRSRWTSSTGRVL